MEVSFIMRLLGTKRERIEVGFVGEGMTRHTKVVHLLNQSQVVFVLVVVVF